MNIGVINELIDFQNELLRDQFATADSLKSTSGVVSTLSQNNNSAEHVYCGQIDNDEGSLLANGQGIRVYNNGRIIEGTFKDGIMHGFNR